MYQVLMFLINMIISMFTLNIVHILGVTFLSPTWWLMWLILFAVLVVIDYLIYIVLKKLSER